MHKKCNYRIRTTTSAKYINMSLDWENDKSWLWTFEPNQDIKEEKEVPSQCLFDFSKFK